MPKETFQLTHQRLLFVLLLAVLFLFTACSSAPSESEGKKFLADQGADLYEVKDFTKTNGISEERGYKMEYEGELECLRSGALNISAGVGSYLIQCQNKGQIGKIKGSMFFKKTENGWRVEMQ